MDSGSTEELLQQKVRATEENFWAVYSQFGRGPGCQLHDESDVVWFETPLTNLPYNGVIRAHLAEDAPVVVDRIVSHFRLRNVPFFWVVHPSATPRDLPRILEERGVKLAETLPGMTMDLADLPTREECPFGFEIREVNSPDQLRPIQEMIVERWDVPENDRDVHFGITLSFGLGDPSSPYRAWAAYEDGEPVCKVLLNMIDGSAGIHGVATKPAARGRGLARVLTLHALHYARERGHRLGMLHSSAMARSLYEKIGFRAVADFSIHVSSGDLHV